MNKVKREQIRKDYIFNTILSWTYARLTKDEQKRLLSILNDAKLYATTEKNVWEELHFINLAFLMALDYQPIGWRE